MKRWIGVALVVAGMATLPGSGVTQERSSGSGRAAAPAGRDQDPQIVHIKRAVVIAIEDIQVCAKQAGELAELLVDDGHVVEQGGVLAQIDDVVAKAKKATAEAEMRIAKAQADSDAKVKAADAVARYADAEYVANEELFRRNVVSSAELRKVKVNLERSIADADVSRLDSHVASLTKEGKEAILAQSTIELQNFQVVARMKEDGKAVVAEVFKHVGDWVQVGEPIVRLVRMDEVRVQGYVDIKQYSPQEIEGQPVTIEVVETVSGRKVTRKVEGTIDFTSSVLEAGGDYRVWAKVKNPQVGPRHWLLMPGGDVEMKIRRKVIAE